MASIRKVSGNYYARFYDRNRSPKRKTVPLRTTGSWLAMQGVPMRVIQGILGHSTVDMTQRYSHLAPEVMEKAMEETFG